MDTPTYSQRFESGRSDIDLNNKNVDWMNFKFFRLSYVLFIFFTWLLLHASLFFPESDCWTVVNIIHGVVSASLFDFLLLTLRIADFCSPSLG
jgi:hypothetical protein